MDLQSFTRQRLVESQQQFEKLSPLWGNDQRNILRPERPDEKMMATFFWQIFLYSLDTGRRTSQHWRPDIIEELFIVDAGNSNYNLVVFHDFTEMSDQVRLISQYVSADDLSQGYFRWKRSVENFIYETPRWENERNQRQLRPLVQYYQSIDENFAQKIYNQVNLPIVFIHKPERFRTHTQIASPSLSVNDRNGYLLSTVGVICTDRDGNPGVTVALHSVRHLLSRPSPQIVVNGAFAHIISSDELSDSCFAIFEVPQAINGPFTAADPLVGKLPRANDHAHFFGATSGQQQTMIQGWSPDLPHTRPGNQFKVTTPPCTNPGDSGAALIDSDGYVVGFAFDRTGIGQSPEFSTWIWADSVYHAHQLPY